MSQPLPIRAGAGYFKRDTSTFSRPVYSADLILVWEKSYIIEKYVWVNWVNKYNNYVLEYFLGCR